MSSSSLSVEIYSLTAQLLASHSHVYKAAWRFKSTARFPGTKQQFVSNSEILYLIFHLRTTERLKISSVDLKEEQQCQKTLFPPLEHE